MRKCFITHAVMSLQNCVFVFSTVLSEGMKITAIKYWFSVLSRVDTFF